MQSGAMRDEIVEALLDAFPDPGDMDIVVGRGRHRHPLRDLPNGGRDHL